MRRSAGFTLLELNFVVAIIGIMASLAGPAYSVYLQRARATEALTNLETIGYLEQVQILETGRAIACEPTPEVVPHAGVAVFGTRPCWEDLGVHMEARVRFQYSVETPAPAEYVVRARGDLDGDDIESVYELDSRTMNVTVTRAGE